MDELSIQDSRLTDALEELRVINRFLGGYSTSFAAIAPLLDDHSTSDPLSILDIGCGGGDFAEEVITWAHNRRPGFEVHVVGIDYNPATVDWAAKQLSSRVSASLSSCITFQCCDAFDLPFADNNFDIVHAALFTHHYNADQVVRLISEMDRVASRGIILNDLHRHPAAFLAIIFLTRLFNACAMVRHDAPLSVRRAFMKDELLRIASAAGLRRFSLSWRWAFRWLLSTVDY